MEFAVGFDFDHTLGIDNKLERTVALDMLASFARERSVVYDEAAAFATIEAAIRSYRAGETKLETALEGFFASVLGPDPVLAGAAAHFREEAVLRAPEFVSILPGVREMLAQLAASGVPYAVLTNGWSPLQEEKVRLIGFDAAVLVSERIGARKPERVAFEILATHLGSSLERLWYVGDDPQADCCGAREAGATAVWFDWEGLTYPRSLPPPDHVIHALSELPELLQGRSREAANPSG
ncbi:MAG: HAD family hydrolase [Vulcanimicrobiaceae bacterium]